MANDVTIPVPRKPRPQVPQVLIFCGRPKESFYVQKEQTDRIPDGDRTRKVVKIPGRWVTATRHFSLVDERDMNTKYMKANAGTDDEYDVVDTPGIREMEGYGSYFVEVIRTKNTPVGAVTLEEMYRKNKTNKGFDKFCEFAMGHSKVHDHRRCIQITEITQAIEDEKARYAAAVAAYKAAMEAQETKGGAK